MLFMVLMKLNEFYHSFHNSDNGDEISADTENTDGFSQGNVRFFYPETFLYSLVSISFLYSEKCAICAIFVEKRKVQFLCNE